MKTNEVLFDGVRFIFVPGDTKMARPEGYNRLRVEWVSPNGEKTMVQIFSWEPGTGYEG